ncbi:riboflavin synthase subunit alpha [Methylophaga lonarensis MPL]|uniref:Riboflavin synthase n=1 Tax=Methylophaga lonarensis MPL TaxID=1286106 RepID=M7NXT5_9GAMM|nr:riboflavin synthase [Methylophaga lonarensis]EMR13608.1 riboflavin synthase subunit alpha [Methylophaga lonarensis MPL]
MFTGIIAAVGRIASLQPQGGDIRLLIDTVKLDISDVKLGDSIAVNGVCLTVVTIEGQTLAFDVSKETLQRTSLASVSAGSSVNLEKALAVGERLGGHFVSGHVDGLGKVTRLQPSARSWQFHIEMPAPLRRYVAEKGSICVDGVSLTVNAVTDTGFEINIIPHTMQETIIRDYSIGQSVNLEVDLIARYLERLLPGNAAGLSYETLVKHGFAS